MTVDHRDSCDEPVGGLRDGVLRLFLGLPSRRGTRSITATTLRLRASRRRRRGVLDFPGSSELIGFSIFIASNTHSVWSTLRESPSVTSTLMMVPCMGTVTVPSRPARRGGSVRSGGGGLPAPCPLLPAGDIWHPELHPYRRPSTSASTSGSPGRCRERRCGRSELAWSVSRLCWGRWPTGPGLFQRTGRVSGRR